MKIFTQKLGNTKQAPYVCNRQSINIMTTTTHKLDKKALLNGETLVFDNDQNCINTQRDDLRVARVSFDAFGAI